MHIFRSVCDYDGSWLAPTSPLPIDRAAAAHALDPMPTYPARPAQPAFSLAQRSTSRGKVDLKGNGAAVGTLNDMCPMYGVGTLQ